MDFQMLADSMATATAVVSVERKGEGNYGKIKLVAGNRAYIDTIEKPMGGFAANTLKFVPNTEYTDYIPRDLNFEDSCYQAAVNKKLLHSYAHPARYPVWFNMSFIPLHLDDEDLSYCLYIVEINFKPDAKRMSNIDAEIASSVLETCINLRSDNNFKESMKTVCEDIRELCDSEHCCVLLMDNLKRSCSVLCEALSKDTKLVSMENYVDDAFYDIADSWKDTIAGSNCLIVRNEHDMEIVRERNPVWHDSITRAGGRTIVLFPLIFKDELLGYIWAINFAPDNASKIKETLELTTFILASEIYSFKLVDRLHILSSRDMLTGVMNRNEMNNYVDELVKGKSDKSVGVIFADLNGLKNVNDNDGHTAGDTLLKNAAYALKELFAEHEIFRAGGDEFVVILTGITEQELTEKSQQIKSTAEKYDKLVFAVGTAFEEHTADIRRALHLADERMYEDKRRFYEQNPELKRANSKR